MKIIKFVRVCIGAPLALTGCLVMCVGMAIGSGLDKATEAVGKMRDGLSN
jgi:hypothetical protein